LARWNSPPGFVWTGDLTQWASDDPVSSWTIVGLSRPKNNASEAEQRQFIEALRNFGNRFPGTDQESGPSSGIAFSPLMGTLLMPCS
jgi:hypothetical protein